MIQGYRCEWCGFTTHGGCRVYVPMECTFGMLQPIYLPPHAVSIPRTEVPMEAIIGVQVRNKGTPLQRDYSCRKYSTFLLILKNILQHTLAKTKNVKDSKNQCLVAAGEIRCLSLTIVPLSTCTQNDIPIQ